MRRHLCSVVLVAVVVTALFAQAQAYQVVSGHPRLFFRAGDLSALRSKATGSLLGDYNKMKSYCDEHMGDSLPVSSTELEWQLPAYSFVWLMGQNTNYAARAKAIAQAAVSSGSTGSEGWIRGGSLFFDWCYDYLTPSERQMFGLALASGGSSYLSSENWPNISCFHGTFSRLRTLIYPGLAIYGEGIDDAAARGLCDTYHDNTYGANRVLCCMDELGYDGSWFEGDYNFNGYLYQSEGFELWATATDENPYDVSTNYHNLATYYIYEMGPSKGTSGMLGSKQGDSFRHSAPTLAFRLTMLRIASRYRDGRAQWLAQEIVDQDLGYVNTYDRWKLIVWTDQSVAPTPPTDLPESWYFKGVGTAYMRSGFNLDPTSTDVYAVFRCERFPDMHTHAHQNHLLIGRGSDILAVDSGAYDSSSSSHHDNYFSRTVAHNTITVFDPNEATFGSYSNDGGQRRPSHESYPTQCGDLDLPQFDRGTIVAFEDADNFTYMKGDATAAYSPEKVSQFTREVVYLKPDLFVVLDRVTATSASFKKRWLLHSINEPQVSGNTTVVQQGDSKLFIKTLLPTPFEIVKVGGSGHQFEVNGVNYPPSGDVPSDAGAWRIEVSPSTSSAENLFLHVLYVAGASVTSMPDVSLVESDEVVGAEIDGHVVLFSRSGIAVDSTTYEYGE